LLEVRFCNPVLQKDASDNDKKSLVFLRSTTTDNEDFKRAARLTSGDRSFSSKTVLRNDTTGDITGIKLVAQESSDPKAFCKDKTRWTVSFTVKCNSSETKALSYDKFTFASDP
jgi:hypothetical protein